MTGHDPMRARAPGSTSTLGATRSADLAGEILTPLPRQQPALGVGERTPRSIAAAIPIRTSQGSASGTPPQQRNASPIPTRAARALFPIRPVMPDHPTGLAGLLRPHRLPAISSMPPATPPGPPAGSRTLGGMLPRRQNRQTMATRSAPDGPTVTSRSARSRSPSRSTHPAIGMPQERGRYRCADLEQHHFAGIHHDRRRIQKTRGSPERRPTWRWTELPTAVPTGSRHICPPNSTPRAD